MTDWPYSDSDVTSRKVFCGRRVAVETERTSPSKLAKRCPLPPGDIKVWTESSLATVTPLTFPTDDSARSIELELAGRESESAQILVTSSSAVDGVRLRLGELVRSDGKTFKGTLKWERVGYIARGHGFYTHPDAPPPAERWLPGPLLPAAPFRVRAASTQGTWITVTAAADAEPGNYRGEVRVDAGGRTFPVPVAVSGCVRRSASWMDSRANTIRMILPFESVRAGT